MQTFQVKFRRVDIIGHLLSLKFWIRIPADILVGLYIGTTLALSLPCFRLHLLRQRRPE